MKITATLNGVKITRDIPTSWDKVTFRNFVDLATIGDDMTKIISYFTVIDEATLKKAKINNLETVLSALSFLSVPPDTTIPKTILGYKLPDNLELESIGQYEDVKTLLVKMQGMGNDAVNLYPVIVGTYAMKEYDGLEVDKFSERFWNAPCGEVLAIGNFTVMKLSGLKKPSRKASPLVGILPKSWRLAIRGYLSNLAFSARYYLWKRKHHTQGTSFSDGQ